MVLRKGQGDLIAISFKVISSTWLVLCLQYEYLGMAGETHSRRRVQNKLTKQSHHVLQYNWAVCRSLKLLQSVSCLEQSDSKGVMMHSKDKSSFKPQWHIKSLHGLWKYFIRSCSDIGEADHLHLSEGWRQRMSQFCTGKTQMDNHHDRLRQHCQSRWRESSGGLRVWFGDWSISSVRKGWGSWDSLAWRREVWEGTL